MDSPIGAGAGGPAPADRLRILLATSDLFPPFRPAAKAIFAEELTRRGHRIDWLMQAESPDEPAGPRAFGNGVAHLAATDAGATRLRRLRKHWLDFRNDCKVFGLLKRGDYSLVQVKDKYLGALLAIAAAKRHRVPFFYWLAYPHADASLYAASHGVARYRLLYLARGKLQKLLLLKVIMPAAAHVFVQSEQMREDLAAEGVPRDKMTPVPSSLNLKDLETPPGERPSVDKPADERWLLYLGTLIRERQLDFLVRVLAAVRRSEPAAKLLFVGRGEMPEDEGRLMGEAERLGVADAVRITGWMPMKEAWEYVRRADVCLSPYCPIPILRSTSPTKLVEYMALGKAVVANDHPEQSLVLRHSGAGLVSPWEEEPFAEAVLAILRDEAGAEAMGRAGRAFVEQYRTHSRLGDVVESAYRKVLEDTVGGARRPAWGVPE
ncbi:MAG: glycosyltransferase family 4 protein [Gammaproteobacteria bacterium]|nr:glycosyltransferase family 4 protein [Gammaproteobacteria bacterium]